MALDRTLGGSGSVRSLPAVSPTPEQRLWPLPPGRRGALGPRVLGRAALCQCCLLCSLRYLPHLLGGTRPPFLSTSVSTFCRQHCVTFTA